MSRLEEALSAYETTIERFPENVVAQTGRAEVLKALGRYTEALALYEEIERRFPEDVVLRTGRAGLLVVMGRHQAARAFLPDDMLIS